MARFVEKPDLDTARRYVQQGDYLWLGTVMSWGPRNLFTGRTGPVKIVPRALSAAEVQQEYAAGAP